MRNLKYCRKLLQTLLSFVIISTLVFAVNSCTNTSKQKNDDVSKEDVKKEMNEATETTMAYLTEEQQKVVNKLEAKIDTAESEIEKLSEEMESAESDVKEQYRQTINSLEEMNNKAEAKIEELKKSSEDAWDEVKKEVEGALSDLEQSLAEAKDEIEKS